MLRLFHQFSSLLKHNLLFLPESAQGTVLCAVCHFLCFPVQNMECTGDGSLCCLPFLVPFCSEHKEPSPVFSVPLTVFCTRSPSLLYLNVAVVPDFTICLSCRPFRTIEIIYPYTPCCQGTAGCKTQAARMRNCLQLD